jgi:cyclomaltodextrinase
MTLPASDAFARPPDWVADAVFYQIFPDRFASSDRLPKPGPLEPWDVAPTANGFKGGDLLGIAERLPYLADLGVTALYLTPIFASASNHRYHTYDYLRVDPLLGGDEALRELLDETHARGMRVILDGVFNHTGRGFWPFHHVLETGPESPYRHWFHIDQQALEEGRPIHAYPGAESRAGVAVDLPGQGEVATPRDGSESLRRLGYRAWWDLPALPKLNTDLPAVREHLFTVAEHWLRFGIDGWRLDVPGEIADPSFWAEFRRRCRAVRPDAYLVGEVWHVSPEWVAGDRFDALMNYPLAEAILSFVAGPHLDEAVVRAHHEYGTWVRRDDGPAFAARLDEILSAYRPETTRAQLNLLDSHDTPRFLTLATGDRASYRLAALLQATLPGAPCVYYGDEIGLEGGLDPDCRRAFPPEDRWDRELLSFVRAALAIRRAQPELRLGDLRLLAASGQTVAFERSGGGRVVVALNAGDEPATMVVEGLLSAGQPREMPLPGWAAEPVSLHGGRLEIGLPARSGRIVRVA